MHRAGGAEPQRPRPGEGGRGEGGEVRGGEVSSRGPAEVCEAAATQAATPAQRDAGCRLDSYILSQVPSTRRSCCRSSCPRRTRRSCPSGCSTELTRAPRCLRWVRTGDACQPPAYCTYRTRRAACPQGATYCTYWVRVPASAVPYVPRTVRTAYRPYRTYRGNPGGRLGHRAYHGPDLHRASGAGEAYARGAR